MDINISNEILASATKCEKNCSCTSGENDAVYVENEVLFIKCKERAPCPYKESFAYSFICKCPVRREIFTKYNV